MRERAERRFSAGRERGLKRYLPLQKWPTNGPQHITLDSGERRKWLIINQASDGIRTRDLSITNRLHYHCATLAKRGGNKKNVKMRPSQ